MSPAFLPPVYDPEPYTFTGLHLQELPHFCQHYLADVAQLLPPRMLAPDAVKHERHRLVFSLFRSLEGTSISLIEKRYDAARDQELNLPPTVAAEKNATRLQEIVCILLPERQRLLDEFLLKFDALLWIDVECRKDCGANDWKTYRDSLVSRVLKMVDERLIELDISVDASMTPEASEVTENGLLRTKVRFELLQLDLLSHAPHPVNAASSSAFINL
ncbi:hypothetical protein CONPUDRAFT_152147 [Coniophora puteana RWD-64-598 SS2]|uniref:Uncharacterized protein n=1 Tax=Coniophora puteana (strain RWD-64-598) TaxID=741705 RepID=A0A5M3MVF2_CONPW|nr:uncharacterized protein CONPUDRAFT_152147 [Coniophora puteana RWD-64-598 SS2]EIW83106.1 hypothetical protein CONPUDRAFT_152147 [Coniophora puteana RWD-64-598 SS2]